MGILADSINNNPALVDNFSIAVKNAVTGPGPKSHLDRISQSKYDLSSAWNATINVG